MAGMNGKIRRMSLVIHVTASVGWLGSVASFLVLATVGLRSTDAALVESSYVGADMITRYAILPLCVAAVVTGLIQSLGTAWGLCRNYWVIAKLVLTLAGAGLLLLHTSVIAELAGAARGPMISDALGPARIQVVADAIAAIALLVVTIGISVFKPHGLTPYGWRKRRAERLTADGTCPPAGTN